MSRDSECMLGFTDPPAGAFVNLHNMRRSALQNTFRFALRVVSNITRTGLSGIYHCSHCSQLQRLFQKFFDVLEVRN